MSRWWSRAEQRKFREEQRKQAAIVANRLLGKKNIPDFFGGSEMQQPIQYGSRTATGVNRMNAMAINKMMSPS